MTRKCSIKAADTGDLAQPPYIYSVEIYHWPGAFIHPPLIPTNHTTHTHFPQKFSIKLQISLEWFFFFVDLINSPRLFVYRFRNTFVRMSREQKARQSFVHQRLNTFCVVSGIAAAAAAAVACCVASIAAHSYPHASHASIQLNYLSKEYRAKNTWNAPSTTNSSSISN